jgi:hypothetical protein
VEEEQKFDITAGGVLSETLFILDVTTSLLGQSTDFPETLSSFSVFPSCSSYLLNL